MDNNITKEEKDEAFKKYNENKIKLDKVVEEDPFIILGIGMIATIVGCGCMFLAHGRQIKTISKGVVTTMNVVNNNADLLCETVGRVTELEKSVEFLKGAVAH